MIIAAFNEESGIPQTHGSLPRPNTHLPRRLNLSIAIRKALGERSNSIGCWHTRGIMRT